MDTNVEITNNYDIHYLIRNEVLHGRESIDLPISLCVQNSFLSKLISNPLIPSFSSLITTLDLNDKDSVLGIPEINLGFNKPIYTEDFITFLNKCTGLYRKTLLEIPYQETILQFINAWSIATSKEVSKELRIVESVLVDILAANNKSIGLINTIFDDLSTEQFIDKQKTTLFIDNELGIGYPINTETYTLLQEDVAQFINGINIVSGEYLDTRIKSASKELINSTPYLISRRVYVSDKKNPVSLVLSIVNSKILSDITSLLINLPINNGIEEIKVRYRGKEDKNFYEQKYDSINESLSITLNNQLSNLFELEISFVSNVIDGTDNINFFHLFVIENIILFKQSEEGLNTLVTKELEFGENFRNVFVELNTKSTIEKNAIKELAKAYGEFYYPLQNKWSSKIPIDLYENNYVTPHVPFDNLNNPSLQYTKPFKLGSSNSFVQINYEIDSSIINGLLQSNSSFNFILDPDDLLVIRGLGSKSTIIDSSNSLLSNDELTGWYLYNNYYCTNVVIQEGYTIEIDFGKEIILINGRSVSGKYKFTSGIYNIKIKPANWHYINPVIDPANIRNEDPFFPYNHKYLIQGFFGVPDYIGVKVFGRQICKYVDPEYLIYNLAEIKDIEGFTDIANQYPSIFSLFPYFNGDYKLVPIFPIDELYNDFSIEKIGIIGKKYRRLDHASKLRMHIDIRNTDKNKIILDSYSIRAV